MDLEIMTQETMKKIPEYNIENVCMLISKVSMLKKTHYDLRVDDVYIQSENNDEPDA